MALANVPAELFMEHAGVEIYHIYKDDCIDSGVRSYWFWGDPWGSDCGNDQFDVRDLETWNGFVKQSIVAAIDSGELTTEGIS